jgi:hypothetical protein
MHRLPLDTDLGALVGKIVEQISIGVHQVILHVEDRLFIAIEGNFSFTSEDQEESETEYRP